MKEIKNSIDFFYRYLIIYIVLWVGIIYLLGFFFQNRIKLLFFFPSKIFFNSNGNLKDEHIFLIY